jgi:hypothetical protein
MDKNKAFSELSVKALKKIKYCAITICSFHVFGLPIFYLVAEKVAPPVSYSSVWLFLLLHWLSLFLLLSSNGFYKKRLT